MQSKKKPLIVIISLLVILASFFYTLFLIPTHTVFYYDQARDAYEAYAIWHDHNLKILGPASDIPGINHGVIWYYFLALIYFLGQGIPENALRIMTVGLYAFIPVMWYWTKKMSKDETVTATSMALYALSPFSISFALWLSNPTLALVITPPLFYFLWQYLHKQTVFTAILIGLFFGLLIQSDFAFIVVLFILPLYYFAFRLKFSFRDFSAFVGGWIAGMLPFFISYLKFQTNIVAIIAEFLSKSAGSHFSVGDTAFKFIDHIILLLTVTYLPLPAMLAFFLLLFVGICFRKTLFTKTDTLTRLLLIWLSGIAFIFIFNRGNLSNIFFYAPFLYPLAMLVALYLTKIFTVKKWLLVVLLGLFALQAMTIYTWASKNESPLSIQKGMTTEYERQVIEYVYQSAGKQPFVISTITNPLYINTTWSYLFETYGKPNYNYLPEYWGKGQEGYLGNLPMQKSLETPTLRYLIIEPEEGIEKYWSIKSVYEEDLLSDIVEEKRIGSFTVQKRLLNLDKGPVATPEALLEK